MNIPDLIWLFDAQMVPLEPYVPKFHGKPRVDGKSVSRGIILINRNGLRWRDAPKEYESDKTLYNPWKPWSDKGIFDQMVPSLATDNREQTTAMIDATYLKAHRTASSLGVKKGGRGRLIDRTKGGMSTKLHAFCDSYGRPLNLFVTASQVSYYIGARALLSSLPDFDLLLRDRGYYAGWFRESLRGKRIRACITGHMQWKTVIRYDKRHYKRRNRIEIMFGRLKDWRRVATRYDRCPKVALSAIALAALVICWLCVLTLQLYLAGPGN